MEEGDLLPYLCSKSTSLQLTDLTPDLKKRAIGLLVRFHRSTIDGICFLDILRYSLALLGSMILERNRFINNFLRLLTEMKTQVKATSIDLFNR